MLEAKSPWGRSCCVIELVFLCKKLQGLCHNMSWRISTWVQREVGEMVAYKSHRAPKWERMGRPENIHGNMLLQTGRNDVSYILETTVYCIWAQFNKPLHQCRTQYLPYSPINSCDSLCLVNHAGVWIREEWHNYGFLKESLLLNWFSNCWRCKTSFPDTSTQK